MTQCVGLAAVLLAPLLGGWQRLERNQLATWSGPGWTLPQALSTRLPRGETARRAHDANKLIGGGLGIEYVGLPAADPLAGGLALLHARGQVRTLLAWLLPALVALVAGRWFCGWLCPFGALARGMSWLFDTIWPRRYRLALPRTRPVRYIVLAATIVASLLGTQLVLFTVLPHFLLQQSVYAAWLLGGGSSVLGVFVGLLVAVALMGPTSYCAAVCPTGATLALLGRKRRVHLTVSSPSRCGAHCRLCNEACWLQLDAASGDPGPDCDVCGRCVPVCPRTNLELRLGAVRSTEPLAGTATARGSGAARAGSAARGRSAVVVGLCLAASCVAMPGPAQAQHGHAKPKLLLDSERSVKDTAVALSVVEYAATYRAHAASGGLEVSLFIARPAREAPLSSKGQDKAAREVYRGPVSLRFETNTSGTHRVRFSSTNSPVSTPKRTLYRRRLPIEAGELERVVLEPVSGWIDRPLVWQPPRKGTRIAWWRLLGTSLASAFAFGGLLSIAYAWGAKDA
ncbi:MAG: 4Fe-4S binding protein [Proteobacteria bacterium]|nr:4Fe-4S binding protein [Pseudomonadota bacterium]